MDAWSVGILAYELVVGFPPFERESRTATLECIINTDPQFPRWMSDGVSMRLFCSAGSRYEKPRSPKQPLGARLSLLRPLFAFAEAADFICRALAKDRNNRPSIPEMLRHPWVQVGAGALLSLGQLRA